MEEFLFALLLPLIAGLSTTIGCIISIFIKKPSPKFISFIMGFSAGVMLLISFLELLQEGISSTNLLVGVLFFFLGMLIMLVIDMTISHQYEFEDSIKLITKENGSCDYKLHEKKRKSKSQHIYTPHNRQIFTENNVAMEKVSILVFLGVFIHNLPEGIATFVGTIKNVQLGLLLAIAISLHNIPEGIAVSFPIYLCTGSRKKAFLWSFLSGFSEFIGALLIGSILFPLINEMLLGLLLSIVAGLMVYISLDELLPVSHSLGKEHMSILGIMFGMFVMFISLVLLG